MKALLTIVFLSFEVFAGQKSGDYFQGRNIKRGIKGGEYLVTLCDEATSVCINQDSYEYCLEKNKSRMKYRHTETLFCSKIKVFKDFDACRKEQYKLIHKSRDFSGLCQFKHSQDL